MSFTVNTNSVVGDVVVLDTNVQFHPTTIVFNGVVFVREVGGSVAETSNLGELAKGRLPAKSQSSNRRTTTDFGAPEPEQSPRSPRYEESISKRTSSSVPPPPPDDSGICDLALFCAACGVRNDKMDNACHSCGSSLRISVLDPELGEQIATARRMSGLSPSASPSRKPPPPPPLKLAALRAQSPNREPPEVPKKGNHLRAAKPDGGLDPAKLKKDDDSSRGRSTGDEDVTGAFSDGDEEKHETLRTRRGNATKRTTALTRSSSAMALSNFKKLETRKALELDALTITSAAGKIDEEKHEPTTFVPVAEFTPEEMDPDCFTMSIKFTSREDHVYYHVVVATCYTTWTLKKRESDMMELWNTLHENKIPDLPVRPRRTTGLGRRSGEELMKRMHVLHDMLEGIFKNKRALLIRATSLFLELYRALLPT